MIYLNLWHGLIFSRKDQAMNKVYVRCTLQTVPRSAPLSTLSCPP